MFGVKQQKPQPAIAANSKNLDSQNPDHQNRAGQSNNASQTYVPVGSQRSLQGSLQESLQESQGSLQSLQRHAGNHHLQTTYPAIAPLSSRSNQLSISNQFSSSNQYRLQLQTKLAIGSTNDFYEQEADRIADAVMQMPENAEPVQPETRSQEQIRPPLDLRSGMQSKPQPGMLTKPGTLQRKAIAPTVNALPSGSQSAPSAEVPASVYEVLRSPGHPLDLTTRRSMERRFGQDFSQVQIYTGATAARSAGEINASAYTVGQRVVFGSDQYTPDTHAGQRLIAHELTHVIQQNGQSGTGGITGATLIQRAPAAKPARIGPAANIPDDRGDVERGYFGTTDKVMYGVRASSPDKPEGLWMDHLFDTQAEAEEYAKAVAAKGALAIREDSALPYAWPAKKPGGMPVTGNPVTHVYVVEVPKDTGYIQGVVRSQTESRKAPWLQNPEPKQWKGGGPQLVLSWSAKTKAVAEFKVAPPPPTEPDPIPPPPDWLTAKQPVQPSAPAAAVATNEPRAIGQLYSPNLVRLYRNQEALFIYSQTALDRLEAKEKSGPLSEEEQQMKATLSAQVAVAQAQMLQARKDYDLLYSPATSPQQVQEMLARRGVAIPVTPQKYRSGAAALKDSDLSAWNLSDKGFTHKSGTATTKTTIGADGMPIARTREKSSALTIGFLTGSKTASTKTTEVSGDKSVAVDQQRSVGGDLTKGEGSYSKGTVTESKDDAGVSTKTSDKKTYTAGLSGVTVSKDSSTQVGDRLDAKGSSFGLTRAPGQLGLSLGETTKSGKMIGPPDAQKMDEGTEKANKLTGGLVSDEKGGGIGGTAGQDRKTLFGNGKSVGTTIAAGGRFQANVKEIPGSEPPKFTITTTISFDVKLGATAGKEWEAKPGAEKDTGLKANASLSGGAAIGMYASFKRQLVETEAQQYVTFIREEGRGSKLPEHMILATGSSQGWESAKQLWRSMHRSPEVLKSMKPGEELETNAEASGDAKLAAGGGESRPGGFSVGGDVGVKGKHKINVKKTVLPDGKIQVTATIDDEGELAANLSGSMGAAGMKAGKSWTQGQGRVVVFILNPADPAFSAQITAIDAAATPEALNQIARSNRDLVDSKTDKKVEGEGTAVGINVGPVAIDLLGKGKLTSEITTDREGKLVASKYTGENQGGGTIGVGDLKVGDSKTETYVGEVDKEGKARGELSQTEKSHSLRKTVLQAGSKIANDPLGAVMNPAKLIEEATDQKGTAIADPEMMSICYEALNKSKWDWKVGGHRHDDWVKAGAKIRAACTVRGTGRTAEIVQVNKHAVQQALAEWTKADVEGRKDVLDAIIRPLGGLPSGKAFAFPDGTESMKPDWDALVIKDPLVTARAQLADKKNQEALTEMQAVKEKLRSLQARIKTAAQRWEGVEIQHAEMLGHISTRMADVDSAIREVTKTIPVAAKPGALSAAPTAVTTVPTAAEVKAQSDRDRATQAQADLEIYNNNIEVMQGYASSVFTKLGQAEAKIKDDSFFSGSLSSRIIGVIPVIKESEDLLKLWDQRYWATYGLYEKLRPLLALDKSRLEKLHPAGARGRWQQVYNLTRDNAMPGR